MLFSTKNHIYFSKNSIGDFAEITICYRVFGYLNYGKKMDFSCPKKNGEWTMDNGQWKMDNKKKDI